MEQLCSGGPFLGIAAHCGGTLSPATLLSWVALTISLGNPVARPAYCRVPTLYFSCTKRHARFAKPRRCASCTNRPAPVALHCRDNASCKPGHAPWQPTTFRRGGPYCTACAPDHVLSRYYNESSEESGQHLGCVSCSELGCAAGACDAITGCARCLDSRRDRRIFEVDGNRTIWVCSADVSLNWPLGPHGA